MGLLADILEIFNAKMVRPEMYGWYHFLWLFLTAAATIFLCRRYKEGTVEQVRRIVVSVAAVVTLLEVYKQINYTFSVTDGVIVTDYQWYSFPFQFCSMPMYVGLLAGIFKKGRIHDALCAFLATYAVFAGICVMIYPNDILTDVIGINIQTMVCHSSMIAVGIYLLYTGYVRPAHGTILKALPVFAAAVFIAFVMNEAAHAAGLLATETFNMFFISPYCEPSLPVYSLIQYAVPFPWCLMIYIAGFTVASYIILLVFIVINHLRKTKSNSNVRSDTRTP